MHNVCTYRAMEEWIAHHTEHTALEERLSLVLNLPQQKKSLYRSRQLTFQLVNLVNQVIDHQRVKSKLSFSSSGINTGSDANSTTRFLVSACDRVGPRH